MLVTPGLAQLAGIGLPVFRPWVMYSNVGVGVLEGAFRRVEADGAVAVLSPLEVLGEPTYPITAVYSFGRFVAGPADLARFAAEACAALPPGAVLAFDGRVGTPSGWRDMAVADVCG